MWHTQSPIQPLPKAEYPRQLAAVWQSDSHRIKPGGACRFGQPVPPFCQQNVRCHPVGRKHSLIAFLPYDFETHLFRIEVQRPFAVCRIQVSKTNMRASR